MFSIYTGKEREILILTELRLPVRRSEQHERSRKLKHSEILTHDAVRRVANLLWVLTNAFHSPVEESATFEPDATIPSIDASNRNKSSNSLRCLLINARSLRNKVLDLKTLLLEEHFPVIAITETWLDAGFMDFELGLKDYSIHRRDRQDRRGGGVLLAVHRNLISIRRRDLETVGIEIAMVEICQKSKDSVLFGVCYRPPNAKMEYSVTLRQNLERIDMTRFATCFLVGDFNFPCIDWHTISPTSTDALTLDFCSLCLMIIFWCSVITIQQELHMELQIYWT